MNMIICDEDYIREVLASSFKRCETARAIGGISRQDQVEGVPIPNGWSFDHATDYWIPPHIDLDGLLTAKPH
jgi:hypothetical protein